jgi:hypothetical protein
MFYVPLYKLQTYIIGCEFRRSLSDPIFKGQEDVVVVVAEVVDLVVIFGVGVAMGAVCYVIVQG